MARYDDYMFASLRPELIEKLKRLETELANELHDPVILLAYEEPRESAQQGQP